MSVTRETPLQEIIHQAFRAWHHPEGTSENLLDFLLLTREKLNAFGTNAPLSARAATNEVLLEALQELAKQDELGAQILRLRFLNQHSLIKTGYQLNLSPDQISRHQAKALLAIARIIERQEAHCRQEKFAALEIQLPPPTYSQLFGFENAQARLGEVLQNPESPYMIALTGLGGLGKTALARATVKAILATMPFFALIWLRAAAEHPLQAQPQLTFEELCVQLDRQLFPEAPPTTNPWPRVRRHLKANPYLIVIDNLESELETNYLFTQLHDLGEPSKILITSRTRPPGLSGVFFLPLDELAQPDALALLRHQARLTGLGELAEAPVMVLEKIYAAVGGNPYALKMVVGLAHVLPLTKILADLPVGKARQIEKMYTHIYLRVWQTLAPHSRTLLQAMPLVAHTGADLDYLGVISGLQEDALLLALQELTARSLIEPRGTILEKRYGIHRLTETFLRTEIIHWPENPG